MTSELQQALLDDDVLVVQRKISQGSYPHAVYGRACASKAYKSMQWIANAHPYTLSADKWMRLSERTEVVVDPHIVLDAHEKALSVGSPAKGWLDSVVSWELRGMPFPCSFYDKLWPQTSSWFGTRRHVKTLGVLHRFDIVQTWLNAQDMTQESVQRHVVDVFKQLWDHAILHCDNVLLQWLAGKSDKHTLMTNIYNGVTVRSLALDSSLARRKTQTVWSLDLFMTRGLSGIFHDVAQFCQFVALYNPNRMRHMWAKMDSSVLIPDVWREFLANGAQTPVEGVTEQRVIVMLHGVFPNEERARMQHFSGVETTATMQETDLVDLF